jgi:hypothetical protein
MTERQSKQTTFRELPCFAPQRLRGHTLNTPFRNVTSPVRWNYSSNSAEKEPQEGENPKVSDQISWQFSQNLETMRAELRTSLKESSE